MALAGAGNAQAAYWCSSARNRALASVELVDDAEVGFLVADGESVVLSVANHGHIAAIELDPAELAELVGQL